MDWNAFAFFKNPFQLYQAPIFFPRQDSGVFHDNLINSSLLIFAPLRHLFGSPLAAYGLSVVLFCFLDGLAFFVVCRALGGAALVSAFCGISFAFLPLNFLHLGHSQIFNIFWGLFSLAFLIHWVRSGRIRWLRLHFIFAFLQLMTPGYCANVLIMLLAGVYGWLLVFRPQPLRAERRRLLRAALVIAVLCLPFYVPYLQAVRHGFSRTLEDINVRYSDLVDYLRISSAATAAPWVNRWTDAAGWAHRYDYHAGNSGLADWLMLLIAIFAGIRTLLEPGKREKKGALLLLMAGALVFALLAAGTELRFSEKVIAHNPFAFVYGLPLFKAMRSIQSFHVYKMIPELVLIALVLSPLIRKNRAWFACVAVLLVFNVIEKFPLYMEKNYSRDSVDDPLVQPIRDYAWLKQQGAHAIAALPLDWDCGFLYLYYSTAHHIPMVNGVTGFFPREYTDGIGALSAFPSAASARYFREIHVDYVVIHKLSISPVKLDALLKAVRDSRDFQIVHDSPSLAFAAIK